MAEAPRGIAALVERALDEEVEAKENGEKRRMTKRLAMVKQLANAAAKGEHRATQLVLALLRDDKGPPASPEPERLDQDDAVVVAELVRIWSSS